MRRVGLLTCVLCLIAAAAEAPQKKKTSTPPAKAATSAKKPAAKKQTSTATKKSRPRKRTPSWRAGQQAPTRERYIEIQEALIQRGYLEGPATGAWGPGSVAALKKFQADQNLEPSGKLNSLSLIALGLGPNREAGASPPSTSPGQGAPDSEPKQP